MKIAVLEIVEDWLTQAGTHRQHYGRPLVSLCYAQSLDGSLTLRRGQPTALSGAESARLTHQLRAIHAAILVGVGTVLADDPRLTVRHVSGPDPQPVILDSRLRTPIEAKLIRQHPRPAWIAATEGAEPQKRSALEAAGARVLSLPAGREGRVSLCDLLDRLGEMGIDSLMVEGGAQVISSMLSQGLADQVILTVAPVFLGGLPAVEAGAIGWLRLGEVLYERLGDDLVACGKLNRTDLLSSNRP
ncbi:MAG: RibD family protein [Anaerolineales bacterium]|nr:RibD family protein [Anaerolineales bacterium]